MDQLIPDGEFLVVPDVLTDEDVGWLCEQTGAPVVRIRRAADGWQDHRHGADGR